MPCKGYAVIDDWNSKYLDTFNGFIQSKSLGNFSLIQFVWRVSLENILK